MKYKIFEISLRLKNLHSDSPKLTINTATTIVNQKRTGTTLYFFSVESLGLQHLLSLYGNFWSAK